MNRKQSEASRPAIHSLLVLTGFLLLACGCEQTNAPRGPRAEGTYIVGGGDGFVVIERGTMGDLRLAKQDCFPPRTSGNERLHTDVYFESGNLQVRHERHRLEDAGWRTYQKEHWDLAPSQDIPGDWDIVRWVRGIHSEPKETGEGDATILVPSFLHQIENDSLPALFEALAPDPARAYRPVAPEEALRLSDEILQADPENPFLRLLRLRVLLLAERWEALRSSLDGWREALDSAPQSLPRHGFLWVEAQLRAFDIPPAENAALVFRALVESDEALESNFARLPKLLALSEYGAIPYWPRIWDCQVFARSVRSSTDALLLEGDWETALVRLGALFHVSRLMQRNGSQTERLLGRGIEMIALGGLRELALRGGDTPEALREIASHLDQIIGQEERLTLKQWASQESPALAVAVEGEPSVSEIAPTFQWGEAQDDRASALLRLTRLAVAERECQIATGKFGTDIEGLRPYLGSQSLTDPFGSGPLNIVGASEGVQVYSIGPDRVDDQAQLRYDPTNGSVSAGDIWIEVRAAR